MAEKKYIIGKIGYSNSKIEEIYSEIQGQVEVNVKNNLDAYLNSIFAKSESEEKQNG